MATPFKASTSVKFPSDKLLMWLGLGAVGAGILYAMKGGSVNPALEPTVDQLATAASTSYALAESALPSVIAGARYASINSVDRWKMWIAQTAHETGGYRYYREVWGPTAQQQKYEPGTTLAERLGNTDAGDGYRFRGRGLIQLTGRANYQRAGDDLGIDLITDPDLAAVAPGAGLVAAWYWNANGLNAYADRRDVEGATRKINGGLTGIDNRLALYASASNVFGAGAA
jgi:putative chitinase